MTHFVNRDGVIINKAEWSKLRNDRSYCILREFDNGEVYVRLEWYGKLTDLERKAFSDTWPVFILTVGNYKADGSLVPDPVVNGETFSSEPLAISAYETFLDRWTESHHDENGIFLEVDNDLAPPPPPDPDKPSSEMKDGPSDFVAW